MKTTYVPGKWLAICDVCGFRYYNDELKKDWRGLMVCTKDYEPRHPQDFLKVRGDRQSVPWVRPEATDIFIPINFTTLATDTISFLEGLANNLNKIIVPVYNTTSAIDGWSINGSAINANSLTNTPSSEAKLVALMA